MWGKFEGLKLYFKMNDARCFMDMLSETITAYVIGS